MEVLYIHFNNVGVVAKIWQLLVDVSLDYTRKLNPALAKSINDR